LGFAWNYQSHASRRALGTIPFLFEPGNIAYSLVNGKGFSSPLRVETGPTAWMTPVYPLLLAGIFRLFGVYTFGAFVAAAGLNILFSTLTCIPIYAVGRRIGGLDVAAILLPVQSMWDASLSAMLAATILWATLALADSPRPRDWCAYGLLWGFALMTSAALILLLPFLLGWAAWRARQLGTAWRRDAALAAGVIVLCCVPWTIRNYATLHALVPLRSVLGVSLWLGNNDQTAGRVPGQLHPITNTAERAQYVELGEIAYMREKQREAFQFMLAHPGEDAELIGNRVIELWSGGAQHPVVAFLRVHDAFFRFTLLFNIITALAALAGIVVLFRSRNLYAFPVSVFPIVMPAVYYLTLASARYRHPVDPAVMLLAAAAGARFVKRA
jgi:hypothetical protein